MKVQSLRQEIEARTGLKLFHAGLLIGSMAVSVLLALIVLFHQDKNRVLVVPPDISKTFWVDNSQVSKEYLLQMGVFLAQLAYDVTPSSVDYNNTVLLHYVDPQDYGAEQKAAAVAASQLKQDQAATMFNIEEPIYGQDMEIALQGHLNTYVTGHLLQKRPLVVMMHFTYRGGRLWLAEMKETSNDDPFDQKKSSAK